MNEQVVFDRLTIADFRGFQRRQQIELDASATIIVGPNGTGKTSFFDAIQWLLIGEIPRLKDRANRRSDDYIVNSWSQTQTATVSAELRLGELRFQVSRTGNLGGTTLELHETQRSLKNAAAQERLERLLLVGEGLSLQEAVATTGLLQQDALLAVIEEDPKQRYAHLARLLGLEALQEYEKTTRQVADSRRDRAKALRARLDQVTADLQKARTELEELEGQQARAPSTQSLQLDLDAVFSRHAQALVRQGDVHLDVDSMSRLGAAARRIRERADELISRGRVLDSKPIAPTDVMPESLEELNTHISELLNGLRRTASELEIHEKSLQTLEAHTRSLAELASRAIPLLDSRCPICRQRIDPEEVRTHLQSVLSEEDPSLQSLRISIQRSRDERDAIELEWRREARRRDDLMLLQEQIEQRSRESLDYSESCAALARGVDVLRPANVDGVVAGDRSVFEAIRQAGVAIEQAAREVAASLTIPEVARRYEAQRLRVEGLQSSTTSLREEVTDANREAKEARELVDATIEGITNITKRRFEQLLPLIREIYARLDPHPAFTRLDYDLDVYYRRAVADPVVIDEELGVRADPLLVFSSSQANVAALTFFLALGWSAGAHSLPFMFLDDPLQAMDDINALGFADLCRHVRAARQLVVSTHDRRLGYLLERKLAPRAEGERTRVLRFVGWDRSGPQIEQSDVEPQIEEAERRVLQEAA